MIQNLSWEFGFWFVSIPLGLNAIAVFFFVPEVSPYISVIKATSQYVVQTTFDREAAMKRQKTKLGDDSGSEKNLTDAEVESVGRSSPTHPPPSIYLSLLRVWNGTFTDESIWRILLRPFPFLLSPVVRRPSSLSQMSF